LATCFGVVQVAQGGVEGPHRGAPLSARSGGWAGRAVRPRSVQWMLGCDVGIGIGEGRASGLPAPRLPKFLVPRPLEDAGAGVLVDLDLRRELRREERVLQRLEGGSGFGFGGGGGG